MKFKILAVALLTLCCTATQSVAKEPTPVSASIDDILKTLQQPEPPKPDINSVKKVPTIVFEVDVNDNVADDAIDAIETYNQLGAKAIVIVLNTPGGSVFAGFRLAREIEMSKAPVICVVDRAALSMGAYLLQSCSKRVITTGGLIMFHEASNAVQGKPKDIQNELEALKVLNEATAEHEASKLKISLAEFKNHIDGKDWWLSSQEALKVGAVDCVANNSLQVIENVRNDQSPCK